MQNDLHGPSLTERLAARLEQAIAEGLWKDKLPGTRLLASQFGVNRKTVLAALELLSQRGVLDPAEDRKARTISRMGIAATLQPTRPKRLLMLRQADVIIDTEAQKLTFGFEKLWSQKYGHGNVTTRTADFQRFGNAAPVLKALVTRHAADALVLFNAPLAWTEAALCAYPTYLAGGHVNHELPMSVGAYSINQCYRTVYQHLANLGHRRILLPLPVLEDEAKLRPVAQQVLTAIFQKPESDVTFADYCPVFQEEVPEVWQSYWQREFNRFRPTAVVVLDPHHVHSLYGFCHSRGIRIPQDLSVISLCYDASLEWCVPPPVMMRYPLNEAVAHFEKWLNANLSPIGLKYFSLEMTDGGSVAACPTVRTK